MRLSGEGEVREKKGAVEEKFGMVLVDAGPLVELVTIGTRYFRVRPKLI